MLGKHVSGAIYCNLRQSKLKERHSFLKKLQPSRFTQSWRIILSENCIFCVSFDTTGTESKKKENVNMHIFKYRNIHTGRIFSDYCLFMFSCFFSPQWSWSLSLCLSPSHCSSLCLSCVPASLVKVSFSCPHLVSALCAWFSVRHVSRSLCQVCFCLILPVLFW